MDQKTIPILILVGGHMGYGVIIQIFRPKPCVPSSVSLIGRVSKFVAGNVFNNVILNSTMNSTNNGWIFLGVGSMPESNSDN